MKVNSKFAVIAAVLAVVAVASISFVAANNSGDSPGTADKVKNLTETVLQVSNLSCGSCLNNIEQELSKSAGMVGMNADLGRGLVAIRHTDELSAEKIATTITGIGYPAKVLASQAADSQAQPALANSNGSGGCGGCGPRGCGVRPPQAPPEKS